MVTISISIMIMAIAIVRLMISAHVWDGNGTSMACGSPHISKAVHNISDCMLQYTRVDGGLGVAMTTVAPIRARYTRVRVIHLELQP